MKKVFIITFLAFLSFFNFNLIVSQKENLASDIRIAERTTYLEAFTAGSKYAFGLSFDVKPADEKVIIAFTTIPEEEEKQTDEKLIDLGSFFANSSITATAINMLINSYQAPQGQQTISVYLTDIDNNYKLMNGEQFASYPDQSLVNVTEGKIVIEKARLLPGRYVLNLVNNNTASGVYISLQGMGFTAVVSQDKLTAEKYVELAMVQIEKKNVKQAISLLNESIIHYNTSLANFNLGLLYSRIAKTPEALKHFVNASVLLENEKGSQQIKKDYYDHLIKVADNEKLSNIKDVITLFE